MKPGYYTETTRKCRFSMDYVTPGYQGLSWAILLKAIEDGCSRDWLVDIIKFYDINLNPEILSKLPANKVKFNNSTNEMMGIRFNFTKTRKKSLLSLQDGLHVKGLANVAFAKAI